MKRLGLLAILLAFGTLGCDDSNNGKADTTPSKEDTQVEDTNGGEEIPTPLDVALPDTQEDIQGREDLIPWDESQPDLAVDTAVPDITPQDIPEPQDLTPEDTAQPDLAPEDTAAPDVAPDVVAGACNNAADIQAFATSSVEDVMKNCAMGCIGKGAECGATCSQEKMGLSQPCSMCVGELLSCTMSKCMMNCISGGQACTDCIADKCGSDFETCAGVAIP